MADLNFIWPATWQETSQPLFWALRHTFKRSSAGDWLFLLTTLHSFSLFLHHENARNIVQGNPKFLKFSRGGACSRIPYKFALSLPTHIPPPHTHTQSHTHTHPTKNPGFAPVSNIFLAAWRIVHCTQRVICACWEPWRWTSHGSYVFDARYLLFVLKTVQFIYKSLAQNFVLLKVGYLR